MADQFVVVMDMKQRRPACVLLQAAMGGDPAVVRELFYSEKWLISPTPDMKRIAGTMEQWRGMAKEVNKS